MPQLKVVNFIFYGSGVNKTWESAEHQEDGLRGTWNRGRYFADGKQESMLYFGEPEKRGKSRGGQETGDNFRERVSACVSGAPGPADGYLITAFARRALPLGLISGPIVTGETYCPPRLHRAARDTHPPHEWLSAITERSTF